ncbi:F-box only protein 48 isoform X2 [Molossus molossus]|uniref:F-box only protein n=1 Tax=Molossus molossus TaxID=27622 RepID=A0A7J8E2G9_MOLMO|nr:F-box only protein 48 isoform X2 [Molossus molossus]KAF6429352.1 F-box protein 48 [Molossus molossus]
MQNNSERNHNSRVSDIELNSVDAENSQNNFFERLPEEVIRQIFSSLDMQSLCRASMTCRRWYDITKDNDSLWKPHCLALRAVCKREIDDDQKSGYSFKLLWFQTNSTHQAAAFCDDTGLALSGHTIEELPEESSETSLAKWQIQQHMFP